MKVEVDADLPAEPRAVWDRMLRWEAQPEWMVDAASVRVVSPLREGTGVRIAVRTRILGVPALTDTLEVTGWDPPRELTMVRNGFVRGTGRWRVEAVTGGTRIEWIEEIRMPIPVLGELLLRAYRPVMRRLMRRSLGNLAARVR